MNAASTGAWRTAAVAMAAIIAALQAFNAWRAFTDPVGFASYFGLPLADPRDAALVGVYGLRALFIATLVALLLAFRHWRALFLTAVAAIMMPAGDAFLTHAAGAPAAIVARHCAIALYVMLTALALSRARAAV